MTSVLYKGVANDLRRLINTELKPGDDLPSEADLVKQMGVSRQTVRSALQALAVEGLVVSVRGKSWAVRNQHMLIWEASAPERNTSTDRSPADAWSNGIRKQGRVPRAEITTEVLLAEGHIGELMEVADGTPLVVRRRLRYADRELTTTSDTYFPRSLVAGTAIELPSDVVPGTYAVLEELGHGFRTREDWIEFRPPSARECDLFGITGPGVSVAIHYRVRRTHDGSVVAVSINTLPGDRNKILYKGAA